MYVQFLKMSETSKGVKNEEIMIIIKELFVNFPRFHRDFDLFVHRDTETQSFDNDYDLGKRLIG